MPKQTAVSASLSTPLLTAPSGPPSVALPRSRRVSQSVVGPPECLSLCLSRWLPEGLSPHLPRWLPEGLCPHRRPQKGLGLHPRCQLPVGPSLRICGPSPEGSRCCLWSLPQLAVGSHRRLRPPPRPPDHFRHRIRPPTRPTEDFLRGWPVQLRPLTLTSWSLSELTLAILKTPLHLVTSFGLYSVWCIVEFGTSGSCSLRRVYCQCCCGSLFVCLMFCLSPLLLPHLLTCVCICGRGNSCTPERDDLIIHCLFLPGL